MNATKSTCPGCYKVFTRRGLSQHLAKITNECCRAVYMGSLPQSLLGSSPYEQASLTSTANSASWGHPDRSLDSDHPSGHDGTLSDSPEFPPLRDDSITTGTMHDGELA